VKMKLDVVFVSWLIESVRLSRSLTVYFR